MLTPSAISLKFPVLWTKLETPLISSPIHLPFYLNRYILFDYLKSILVHPLRKQSVPYSHLCALCYLSVLSVVSFWMRGGGVIIFCNLGWSKNALYSILIAPKGFREKGLYYDTLHSQTKTLLIDPEGFQAIEPNQ